MVAEAHTGYEHALSQNRLPLAVLRIPTIHLEVPLFDGTDELILNRGEVRHFTVPDSVRATVDGKELSVYDL